MSKKQKITKENLLLKCSNNQNYQDEFKNVTEFYGSDINKDQLETQLLIFKAKFKELKQEKVVLNDIVEFMKKPGYSDLLSEVATVLKLILVLPATNAQSERVFSALKVVETYLRNTMGQARLNHILMMYVQKEAAEKLSLAAVANEFAAKGEKRRQDFGLNKFV